MAAHINKRQQPESSIVMVGVCPTTPSELDESSTPDEEVHTAKDPTNAGYLEESASICSSNEIR